MTANSLSMSAEHLLQVSSYGTMVQDYSVIF